MFNFSLCLKSCITCAAIVTDTTFYSSANGGMFTGIYEFDDKEAHTLNCKSVNVIYMLQCKTCNSQYVGETVQSIKDRISGHRGCTVPHKENSAGNFRLRQHYACSDGYCKSFKIYILQKLPGTGRTAEVKENTKQFKIDPTITKIRKKLEDVWIMRLHTQYPYGCNDRIDSLEFKASYNCEFAKFKSIKVKRQRSWNNKKCDKDVIDFEDIINNLLTFVNSKFDTSCILAIKRILFPLKHKHLLAVRDFISPET